VQEVSKKTEVVEKLRRSRPSNSLKDKRREAAIESLREASQVSEQVKVLWREPSSFQWIKQRKNGRSKSSEEISRSSRPLDLAEVQGGYDENVRRFKAQEGQSQSLIRVTRTVRSTRDIVYRGFVSRSSKVVATRIAISRSMISREPRTIHQWGRVSGDPRKSGFGESGVSRTRNLAAWNRDPRYPDGELCGATTGVVEDRWRNIGDRGKESPESIDIRIRDPVNPEILIEVTGVKRQLTRTSEFRCIGYRESVNQSARYRE
jgi:hypothetical protein